MLRAFSLRCYICLDLQDWHIGFFFERQRGDELFPLISLPQIPGKPGVAPQLSEVQSEGEKNMSLIELQKLVKMGELLGTRHSQRAAVFLQVASSLSTLGAIPLKTTSWRCFQSSQQQRRRKVEAASRGAPWGVLVSQSLWTSLGCHPILLQKERAKEQPDTMWFVSSSWLLQSSQVASGGSRPFFSRLALHWILSWISS
jgi:hypothetical protein